MVPESNLNIDVSQVEYTTLPTKTYRFDIANKRIIGVTDGLEAYKIACEKNLRTGRYDHVVYDGDYGSGVTKYVGKDFDYIKSAIQREVFECLSVDDRFQGIEDFIITQTGIDHCKISFKVISNVGIVPIEMEV